eukprot:SAG31_NODE_1482_length_8175_cov_4.484398_10_plen_61_part_00
MTSVVPAVQLHASYKDEYTVMLTHAEQRGEFRKANSAETRQSVGTTAATSYSILLTQVLV